MLTQSHSKLYLMLKHSSVKIKSRLSLLFFHDMKINLTDNGAQKEGRLAETEAELAHSQAACTRLSQVINFSLNNFLIVVHCQIMIFFLGFLGRKE